MEGLNHVTSLKQSNRSTVSYVYNNGLLLKGQRIIIPISLRSSMKVILHQGHNGIERCKNRARQSIFWPGINSEIEDLVSNCSVCQTYRNRQQKETLIQHTIYGHDYVIVTDYFSKYIERLTNKASSTVVNKIKEIFSRHGIPKELCADNGPEYTASCFKRFAKEWDFKHTTSSPHFPQSNGFVERAIQTVKKVLKKAHDGNQDLYLALLILNTTPGNDNQSPASRLFCRQPRSTLPSLILSTSTPPNLKKRQAKTKARYNKQAKDLPDIQPGPFFVFVRRNIRIGINWAKL